MPSAMSRLKEPVDTVSISTTFSFEPRRMIEPLPKDRSIWDRAASSALLLSTDFSSTSRNVFWAISSTFRLSGLAKQCSVCTRFVL